MPEMKEDCITRDSEETEGVSPKICLKISINQSITLFALKKLDEFPVTSRIQDQTEKVVRKS